MDKVKSNHLNCPLVAGCSINHKPLPPHVSKWEKKQVEKTNCTLNNIFSKMVLAETDSRLVKHMYQQDLNSIVPHHDSFELLNPLF